MADRYVPVLIVGGGGAGLTASLLASQLGLESLLVERHPGTAIYAKAHILNPRTMEIFEQLGVADDVYDEGTPIENYQRTTWYTSLGGDEPWDRQIIQRLDSWGGGKLASKYAAISAMRHGNLPQMWLEPLLRRHAEERAPGSVLFHHELVSFEQDDEGVVATILDRSAAKTWTVRADYMVAADGGKTIGPALGVTMLGRPPFIDMVSVHIRADLSHYLQEDDSVIRLIGRPTLEGGWIRGGLVALGPDRWDRRCPEWRIGVALPLDRRSKPDYSHEQALDDARALLKLPELELEVVSVAHWLVESVLADRYQVGRIALVGDAAHRHSPMGGLGLNTGIQDVHNLMWKLALLVQGRAGDSLLASYSAERRPVGQRVVDFATFAFYNHIAVSSGFGLLPGAPLEYNQESLRTLFDDSPAGALRRARLAEFYFAARMEFQASDLELGFDYSTSDVVAPDGSPAPERDPLGSDTVQCARPGHRLPHAWLEHAGEAVATHALVDPRGFLLLAGDEGDAWIEAGRTAARRFDVPLTGLRVGPTGDFLDPTGIWTRLRGHGDDGVVLVRPDGHVAFRSERADDECEQALHAALGRTLGHFAASGRDTDFAASRTRA